MYFARDPIHMGMSDRILQESIPCSMDNPAWIEPFFPYKAMKWPHLYQVTPVQPG